MLRQLCTCSERARKFIAQVCRSLPHFFGPVQEELLDVCVSLMDPDEPEDYAVKASPDARVKREKPARSPSPEAKRARAESDSEDELLVALVKPGAPPPLPPPSAPPEDMDKDSDLEEFGMEDMVPQAATEDDEAEPKRVVRKARKNTKQQQKDELKQQCTPSASTATVTFRRRARAPMPAGHWTKFQQALVLNKPLPCWVCRDLRDEFTTPTTWTSSTATRPAACGAAGTCSG